MMESSAGWLSAAVIASVIPFTVSVLMLAKLLRLDRKSTGIVLGLVYLALLAVLLLGEGLSEKHQQVSDRQPIAEQSVVFP